MSFDTYADLQTAVASWLRRSDLTAQIPDFITLAESDMNRELKTARQLVEQPYTITGEFTALPTGFRQMRSLRLTSGTYRLLREVTPEQMAERKAVPSVLTSEPWEFTAIGAQLEFYPVPDQSYTAVMEFQAGFAPLSNANPTNWILTDHPDAYFYGALSAALAYVKNDDRAAAFQQQFMRVLGEVQHALRTSYDRTLRVDPGIRPRRPGTFNILTGDF